MIAKNISTIKVQFLKSFFNLFEAEVLITKVSDKNDIYGTLSWQDEEDMQDFRWSNFFNDESLVLLKHICDFILENKLNDNDRILIPETKLKHKLLKSGWNPDKIEKGIECLMVVNIRMVDDGEETDSFFIHF